MLETVSIGLIVALPLLGFVVLSLFGKRVFGKWTGMLGTGLMLVTTLTACYLAYRYFFVTGRLNDTYQAILPLRFEWLAFSPRLTIDMGFLLDPISCMMLVVVTLVSLMVHIFSIGYMKGEERYPVYFAYLSLFTFSMLGLVLSTNIFQIYIFWELVGVSSYLLIGFYYDKPSAVAASKKAFIVTRFADLGFLVGILILSFYGGTLDFHTLLTRLAETSSPEARQIATASFMGISALTWGLVLVFMGGAGKSAMFPLHVWLPDAMEGPTPVSALIHAATMVVAGVYLVARMFPLFSHSEAVMEMITLVGAFSALFAAVIGCTQTDIKRVLAYSTMSQIGFMMFSLGVARNTESGSLGYTASMFHLFTHAMFKALLFLCAGAIIHYVHSNEMKDMGGLRKAMPYTHLCFLVGCLAIAGTPFFSGFFSKEEILLAAYERSKWVYGVGLITSGLTSFYMFRLYFMIFWNSDRKEHKHHTGNEGGWTTRLPLFILATGAVLAGYIPFGQFISANGKAYHQEFHPLFAAAPVILAMAGFLVAWWLYKTASNKADRLATSLGVLYTSAHRKFYIDELYLFITRKIVFNLVARPAAWFDKKIVDGLVNFSGTATQWVAEKVRKWQSGKLQDYAIYMLAGIVALLVWFIYRY